MEISDNDKTIVLDAAESRVQHEESLKSGQVRSYQEIGPGSVLGNWRILQLLAHGGMGDIFICHPLDAPQSRAVLKILNAQGLRSETGKKRFQREYQLQKELNHPFIAKMLEINPEKRPQSWLELLENVAVIKEKLFPK